MDREHENEKSKTKVYINKTQNDDDAQNELLAYREKRKNKFEKKKKFKKRSFILLAVVVLAAAAYFCWDIIAPEALSENVRNFINEIGSNKYPVDFGDGTTQTAVSVGSDIGILTDTSFIIYSRNGTKLVTRPHGFNNPYAVCGGGRALIFDLGGKQFSVETRFSEPLSQTMDYAITSAAMGGNGSFAIITEAENYLSELTAYSNSNKAVFKWDSSQGRILCADISPDGKMLAAVVTGARKGSVFSDIYIFNLSKKDPVAVKKYDDTFFYSVKFKDNKRLAAVGTQKAVFLYTSGKEKSVYSFGENEALCTSNSSGPVVIAFKKTAGSTDLVSLDGEGKKLGETKISGEVNKICQGGGRIVALQNSKVTAFDSNLKIISKISIPFGPKAVIATGKYIFAVGTQSVGRYDIK